MMGQHMNDSKMVPIAVANLRKIWQQKKVEMHFTQVEAAKDLEWSQSAISHYLSNITDLGPAAIVKFANFLDVDPTEIDPDIEHKLPHVHKMVMDYNSDDMTRPIKDAVYTRKNSVSSYIQLGAKACIEDLDGNSIERLSSTNMKCVAQICAISKYPSAKIVAVRIKNEKQLRFYLKTDMPKQSKISKVWAVVSFSYI